jgi:hypothetical protein
MTLWHDDPTLAELIGDPLTQAIMNADRVDPPKLEAMLRSLAREIGGRSDGSARGLAEAAGAPFDRNAAGPAAGVLQDTASCSMSGSSMQSQHCGAP